MKKSIVLIVALMLSTFAVSFAQDAMAKKDHNAKHTMMKKEAPRTIQLEQTEGVFTVQGLTLSAGTYVFEVSNSGVDHAVGFVLAPKGKTDQAHHIKEAYVAKTIGDGETSQSKEVKLSKGEYVYFCPLNPTPQYTLVVE